MSSMLGWLAKYHILVCCSEAFVFNGGQQLIHLHLHAAGCARSLSGESLGCWRVNPTNSLTRYHVKNEQDADADCTEAFWQAQGHMTRTHPIWQVLYLTDPFWYANSCTHLTVCSMLEPVLLPRLPNALPITYYMMKHHPKHR